MATGWMTHERYMWHDVGAGAGYLPAGGMIEPDIPFIEELRGMATGVDDPFLPGCAGLAQQELQPHQEAVIAAAEANVAQLVTALAE
jgi:hypothetical protein